MVEVTPRIVVTCSRCHKIYEVPWNTDNQTNNVANISVNVGFWDKSNVKHVNKRNYDLCDGCCEEFYDWLYRTEKAED